MKTKFQKLLDEIIDIYQNIQEILLISLNDVFLSHNLIILKNNKLINDTIEIIQKYNYDIERILNSKDITDNLFIKYFIKIEEILRNPIIEEYTSENIYLFKNKKMKKKKGYEVNALSSFLIDKLNKESIKNIIEMGCGKSYLTDYILLENDIIYIGIDKKDELIEKMNKKSNNYYLINHFITIDNFQELYKTFINDKINIDNKLLLFGLHSCGNLTSDSIRIFIKNDCFSHLAIIGCCLNLLTENISYEAKQTESFKSYIQNTGYDMKGNFLDKTLVFDNSIAGFPLSDYISSNYKNLYLSRVVRNSSMQTIRKDEKIISINRIYYKKIYFRTLFQSFLEEYFPEMKSYYGFGKIEIIDEMSFYDYTNLVFKNVDKIISKNNSDNIFNLSLCMERYTKFNKDELNSIISNFLQEHIKLEDYLWAVYIIRPLFAKIVEYLITIDRVIYLLENKIKNVQLMRIFDSNLSVRNLLIYAYR